MLYLHGLECILYLTKSLASNSSSSWWSPKCGFSQGSVSTGTAVTQALISPIVYGIRPLAGLLLILSQLNPFLPLLHDFPEVQTWDHPLLALKQDPSRPDFSLLLRAPPDLFHDPLTLLTILSLTPISLLVLLPLPFDTILSLPPHPYLPQVESFFFKFQFRYGLLTEGFPVFLGEALLFLISRGLIKYQTVFYFIFSLPQ